jgi:hypothetical protein
VDAQPNGDGPKIVSARFDLGLNPGRYIVGKNQNTFEKRRREVEKRQRAEEKRKRRQQRKDEPPTDRSSVVLRDGELVDDKSGE